MMSFSPSERTLPLVTLTLENTSEFRMAVLAAMNGTQTVRLSPAMVFRTAVLLRYVHSMTR